MQQPRRFSIPGSHPSLAGHFPGQPIVPGVLVLDQAVALVLRDYPSKRLAELTNAKFLAPVLPGDEVTVSCSEAAGGLVIICEVAGRTVLRGLLHLGDER
jgi:3-hydroxyacyl-[acyl-carrier-protein] dehydratase